MSSQYETWYKIENGKVYLHGENDGYALLRKGFEKHDELLGTIEEVKTKWPSWFKKEFPNEME